MGLETVELMMDVEDRFGVWLPDAEATEIITVADLAAAVRRRLEARGDAARVRPVLREQRRQVRESVARMVGSAPRMREGIRGRLTSRQQHRVWRDLTRNSQQPPPPRRHSALATGIGRVWWLCTLACVLFTVTAPWRFGAESFAPLLAFALWVLVWLPATILLYRLLRRFSGEPPAGCRTFGDLARSMCGGVVATVDREDLPDPDGVLLEVRKLVAHCIGTKLEEVRPESRFVQDLRVG